MTLIFEPPTDDFVFPVPHTPDSQMGLVSNDERRQRNLAKHYASTPRGRNVFLLVDGTVTENEPGDPAQVQRVYHGAHRNPVSAQEAAVLTAAGYGAYIS